MKQFLFLLILNLPFFSLSTEEHLIQQETNFIVNASSFTTELEIPLSIDDIDERRVLQITDGENPLIIHLDLASLTQHEDGIEIQGQFTKGPLKGYMQYMYTEADDIESLRIQDHSMHLGSLGFDYSFDPKLTSGITLTHKRKRANNSSPYEEQVKLNIHSYYNINKRARVGVALKNLTNKKDDIDNIHNLIDDSRRAWIILEIKNF